MLIWNMTKEAIGFGRWDLEIWFDIISSYEMSNVCLERCDERLGWLRCR